MSVHVFATLLTDNQYLKALGKACNQWGGAWWHNTPVNAPCACIGDHKYIDKALLDAMDGSKVKHWVWTLAQLSEDDDLVSLSEDQLNNLNIYIWSE